MYIEKMSVGELRKALADIPDDYGVTLESLDGVSVRDGEGIHNSAYEINSRNSEIKYVERDDNCNRIVIQMDITLE